MNVLFIHQNFPGQFVHLAADFVRDGHTVVALTTSVQPVPANVIVRQYSLLREPATETHPLLREQEVHILRAEACAAAALQLKREGFEPDLVVAHPGWGEALFIKDVFPKAKLAVYCEFYYAAEGRDVGFDPEQAPLNFAQRCKLRLKNTTNLLSLEIADAAISPTEWQRSTYPEWAQRKITVIHDGLELSQLRFDPAAQLAIQGSNGTEIAFRPGAEVVSYVARNLEPVRGFHVFMRTLPEILRRRPHAHAIIVGGDGVSYGMSAPGGRNWREHLLAEVGGELDMRRVHFTGQVSYEAYRRLLSISRVHTYWTIPFVLSWSFLEAAASGIPVVASATPPVTEFAARLGVATHGFFDQAAFADAIVMKLENHQRMSLHPSQLAELDRAHCVRAQRQWLGQI